MDLVGTIPRPLAVITGAYGGTGRAVARRLGLRYRLVLSGRSQDAVSRLRDDLEEEGYDVAATAVTDVAERGSVQELAAVTRESGAFGTLVHTAGLSPAMADWETLLRVNLVGTAHLLDAFLDLAVPGSSAVCVGSVAAYTFPATPDLDDLIDRPLADDTLAAMETLLRGLDRDQSAYLFALRAYGASKRGVLRLVERSADVWGQRGARVVSISPGTVVTPMGRREMEGNPLAAAAADITPLRRLGMPVDIAAAVDFLTSDAASYVTGCDLRVDGGIVAARLHVPRT